MNPAVKREMYKFLDILKKSQPQIKEKGLKGKEIKIKGDTYIVPPTRKKSYSSSRLR